MNAEDNGLGKNEFQFAAFSGANPAIPRTPARTAVPASSRCAIEKPESGPWTIAVSRKRGQGDVQIGAALLVANSRRLTAAFPGQILTSAWSAYFELGSYDLPVRQRRARVSSTPESCRSYCGGENFSLVPKAVLPGGEPLPRQSFSCVRHNVGSGR